MYYFVEDDHGSQVTRSIEITDEQAADITKRLELEGIADRFWVTDEKTDDVAYLGEIDVEALLIDLMHASMPIDVLCDGGIDAYGYVK